MRLVSPQALRPGVVLLAFFEKNDLKGDAAGQGEVVRRLRAVAPRAEAAGVILGVESWLDVDDIGYQGWVQIEGAVPEKMDLMGAYRWNSSFLRGVLKG